MANVVEKIFELDANTSKIIKELQQLKGVYQELTEEQVKQVAELKQLEIQEQKLKAVRDKSNNPTSYIQINKLIDENTKKLGYLRESVDKFTVNNHKARVEVDALGTSLSNAFKGTQVNAVKGSVTQFNALGNSLNQINRELPAFAVSASIGFLAISNNLPIFFDALEKVKKENAALAAQGQKTTSVMSQLGSAIFSTGSILSIGVTLLTIYGKAIVDWTTELFEGEKALESVKTANEEFNKSISRTSAKIVELTIDLKVQRGELTKIEGNLLKNENARTAALNANKELRKKSIDDLKKELEISDKLLANSGKTRQVVTQGGEVKEIALLSAAEENRVRRFKEQSAQLTYAYKLENDKINEQYNLQGQLEKESGKIHKAKKERIKELTDLSDRIRQLGIDDIKEQQKQEIEQAEFDTERAIRDMKLLKATGEQKTALEIALNNDLVNKLEAIDKKYRDKQDDESRAQAKETGEAMNAVLEDNATTEITILERKIKKLEAQNKKANADEIKNLKVQVYEKKKLLLDLQESEAIANLKQNEQGQVNEAERYQIEVEFANKRKKLEFDLLDAVAEKQKKTNKERMNDNVKYFADLLKAAIDAANQIINLKIKEIDQQSSLQQKRVDEAKNIADRGNAEQLEMEQKRLDDLNKKREQYVRQQQALAVLELVANTAVAVSKAASQTGVAAGVGIAAALLALVAGLASARAIASQAAFYEGGYTGDGNPREESNTIGGRRANRNYTWHKGEFVMDHKKTRKYRDIFEDVHAGKIDLREWQEKANQYDLMANRREFMLNPNYSAMQAPVNIDMSAMEKEMRSINENLKGLYFGLQVDENGFTMRQRRLLDRKETIKKAAKL